MSAVLEWNFLNASVYPKHECAVLELISPGRRGKERVHKWWLGPCEPNPVGSENEHFK